MKIYRFLTAFIIIYPVFSYGKTTTKDLPEAFQAERLQEKKFQQKKPSSQGIGNTRIKDELESELEWVKNFINAPFPGEESRDNQGSQTHGGIFLSGVAALSLLYYLSPKSPALIEESEEAKAVKDQAVKDQAVNTEIDVTDQAVNTEIETSLKQRPLNSSNPIEALGEDLKTVDTRIKNSFNKLMDNWRVDKSDDQKLKLGFAILSFMEMEEAEIKIDTARLIETVLVQGARDGIINNLNNQLKVLFPNPIDNKDSGDAAQNWKQVRDPVSGRLYPIDQGLQIAGEWIWRLRGPDVRGDFKRNISDLLPEMGPAELSKILKIAANSEKESYFGRLLDAKCLLKIKSRSVKQQFSDTLIQKLIQKKLPNLLFEDVISRKLDKEDLKIPVYYAYALYQAEILEYLIKVTTDKNELDYWEIDYRYSPTWTRFLRHFNTAAQELEKESENPYFNYWLQLLKAVEIPDYYS